MWFEGPHESSHHRLQAPFLASIITRGATAALGSWHSNKITHPSPRFSDPPTSKRSCASTSLTVQLLEIRAWNLWPGRNQEIDVCVLMWFDPLKVCMYDIRDIRDIIKVYSSKMKLKVKVNVKRRRSLTITIRSAQYRGCSTKEDSTRLALWYRSLDGEFSAKVDVSVIFA